MIWVNVGLSAVEVEPLLLGEDADEAGLEHGEGGPGVANPPEGEGAVVAQVLGEHLPAPGVALQQLGGDVA